MPIKCAPVNVSPTLHRASPLEECRTGNTHLNPTSICTVARASLRPGRRGPDAEISVPARPVPMDASVSARYMPGRAGALTGRYGTRGGDSSSAHALMIPSMINMPAKNDYAIPGQTYSRMLNDCGTSIEAAPGATPDFAAGAQSQPCQGCLVLQPNGQFPMYTGQRSPIWLAPTNAFSMSPYDVDPSVAQLASIYHCNIQGITSIKRAQMKVRQQLQIVAKQLAWLEATKSHLTGC